MTAITRRLGSRSPWVYGLPLFAALAAGLWPLLSPATGQERPAIPTNASAAELANVHLLRQTAAEAAAKSAGCITCHQNVGDPHAKETLHIGCVDCHGGDATTCDKLRAHVAPSFPEAWRSSANPVRSYTLLNHEAPDFIRF